MKLLLTGLIICLSLITSAQEVNEKEVSIEELKGTITLPSKKSKKAIMLISGSGPTDRDGNNNLGFTNNSLKMVAHEFTKAGYAVLRFDKRGIAESAAAISDPAELRFENFVNDAKSWLEFLEMEGFKQIIIAGHSQGSLIGILTAQGNSNVKGLISISGLAEDAGEAIVRQIGQQAPVLAEEASEKIDSLRKGYTVKKYNPLLVSLFNDQVQPFLKSYLAYNPSEEIQKLDIPVLIVNGTSDLQVREEDANALKESYPNAELLIIEEMNHVLKHAAKGDMVANVATYNNPDLPLKEGLTEGMINFIKTL